MKIVAISDTHGLHRAVSVPEGDVLVHAGDLTARGKTGEIPDFDRFLASLPHRHKIVIAGNHDFCFQDDRGSCERELRSCVYLQDSGVEIEGVRFWGSPWQPWFYDWAFNLKRGPEIRAKWDLIPAGTDVLVTHGPPLGFGDMTVRKEAAGCADLLDAIRRVKPRLHVYGHIHEGYSRVSSGGTEFVNASICDFRYAPVNPPVVIDL